MKIFVTGTRGIPEIQGGVETHCENLYPRIVSLGGDVTLIRRSCYVKSDKRRTEFKGVKLKDIYAPRKKSIEAIIHTLLSVIYIRIKGGDVIHIHAIGPALLTPFARILGLKVVVTHHGADYKRDKWGRLAKRILRMGEKMAVKYANQLIVISDGIRKDILEEYGRSENVHLIYNGVNKAVVIESTGYINTLGLAKHKYIFALGRFVEEKGFHQLIDAYDKSSCKKDYKLVIAGDADHKTEYSEMLKQKAKDSGVVLPGFVKGDNLSELFSHARLFVLPSFHEGMPIALLEAMSYGLDVLVSNIPANTGLISDKESLFDPFDTKDVKQKLEIKLSQSFSPKEYDMTEYDWNTITEKTLKVLTLNN